ncbi:MAG: DUF3086 domain-containing protein [Cyanobacteria bacterium J06600_6]
MNSETPANPESDKIIFEPVESSELSETLDEPATDIFDAEPDMWSSETTDVTLETETQESEIQESETKEPEFLTELSELGDRNLDLNLDLNLDSNSQTKSEPQSESEISSEPELFVDTWLDESKPAVVKTSETAVSGEDELEQLEQQKSTLQREIAELKTYKEQVLLSQVREAQESMGRIIEEGTKELVERKAALRIEIEKLERRQARINQEMRSNFAGSSKELAIRVQGFKEYLVGSLQDLASAADKLELTRTESPAPKRERVRDRDEPRRESRDRDSRSSRDNRDPNRPRNRRNSEAGRSRNNGDSAPRTFADRNLGGQFSEPTFADRSKRIRQLLDKYCNSPDYYGSPWQLRRTFDRSQAQKVQEWFFSQGGRGAIDGMGSRLQNILVASSAISILHDLYRDRTQFLVLTDTPENLGEWRKGLEDCLGISRRDFGTNRGIVLFDSPDVLVQRAERLIADKLLPVIIIDETEDLLNLSVLKFPIWLAFTAANRASSANYLY